MTVTVVTPTPIAVTRPVTESTVATSVSSPRKVTTTALSAAPAASTTVPPIVTVSPSASMASVDGATSMSAAPVATRTVRNAWTAPAVPVTVVLPCPMDVTTPSEPTVAIAALATDHTMSELGSPCPPPSRIVADTVWLCCNSVKRNSSSLSVTVAGTRLTVICAVPTMFTVRTRISAVPSLTAWTMPRAVTAATAGLVVVQWKLTPVAGEPSPATSWAVS